MKVLVVIAHVDPKNEATSYRLAKAAEEALKEGGHEVKTTDLIKEGFDRVATVADFKKVKEGPFMYHMNTDLDNLGEMVRKQQEMIEWCSHILIIGPMWYFRYPACLDAWLERCFTRGWAYGFADGAKKGKLEGKVCGLVITTGAGKGYYATGTMPSVDTFTYTTTMSLRYCGAEPTLTLPYYGANDPEVVKKEGEWVALFKKAVCNLDKWPRLKFDCENGKNEADVLARIGETTVESLAELQ